MKNKIFLFLFLFLFLFSSCQHDDAFDRRYNKWVPIVKVFGPKRMSEAYNHTLIKMNRNRSDCQPECPRIDAWKYSFQDENGELLESDVPISTKKKYWKVKDEARVIAFSLFGDKPEYLDGLMNYLDSFTFVKEKNGIEEKNWGYESFTVRVYSPKRHPSRLEKMGPLKGELSSDYVTKLLSRGVEVVYVDNAREKTVRDASFWRFLILDEPLLEGEKIRFLLRDADWILTAAELFSVGEWIASGLRFHRMHLVPICVGPLTASWWGGIYTKGEGFKDILKQMEYYPYRLLYGDDELFLRDLVWPKILASGSVLTHRYEKRGAKGYFANPYKGSCEDDPTRKYCSRLTKNTTSCLDLMMPEEIKFPFFELGTRVSYEKLKKREELFILNKKDKRVEKAFCAFSPSCLER